MRPCARIDGCPRGGELKEDLEGLTQAMLKKIGGDLKESQSDALAKTAVPEPGRLSCMQVLPAGRT